jgi:endonuclease/exonuclease/phosphatase (EEP) superfamily protein YafD
MIRAEVTADHPAETRPSGLVRELMASLLRGVVLGLLLASLLAYGAELSWLLERLVHLRVQLALSAVLLLPGVALLRTGRRRWCVVLLLALALNGSEVVDHYALCSRRSPPIEVVESSPPLRIFYANLLASNSSAARLIPQIEVADADLLVLLELTPAWERRLEAPLAAYPHRLLERREDDFGLGLYSRVPLGEPALHASVVHGFDLAVPLGEAVIQAPWGPLRVVAAHPVPPVGEAARDARDRQLDELAGLLGARPMPTVLVGDLNTTVFTAAFGQLEAATGLRNALADQPWPWLRGTWPAGLPAPLRIPIDHALISPDLVASESRLGEVFGSDHLPLVFDLRRVEP